MMRIRIVHVLFVTLTAIFLLPPMATAQPGAGVKAGIAISKLSTTPDIGEDALSSLTDFSAGAFVVASDSPVTAQIEALVSRRGASIGGDLFDLLPGGGFALGNLFKLRITYLDVSALLRAQLGAGPSRVYVFGGPTVGFKLKSELVVPGFSPDLDAITEDLDIAVTGGIGVEANHLILEGRYSHGLSDIIPTIELAGIQVRHRTATVMIGVRF
jgi:hypothetical protein